MKILIATKNRGKFKEIVAVLSELEDLIPGLSFHTPEDFGIEEDFEEIGESFEENALGKARFFAAKAREKLATEGAKEGAARGEGVLDFLTVADDSGIFIDALADELGVQTRRWGAGHEVGDEEWLAHFMERMAEEENRKAKFVCAAALVLPSVGGAGEAVGEGVGEGELVFLGETHGEILLELGAPVKQGIPLSSVFKAHEADKVYAAMTDAEKNAVSHRGKALTQILEYLKNNFS